MNTLTMNAFAGRAHSDKRERLAEHRRRARQTLRRAATVMTVLVLGGVLHAMRLASMLVL